MRTCNTLIQVLPNRIRWRLQQPKTIYFNHTIVSPVTIGKLSDCTPTTINFFPPLITYNCHKETILKYPKTFDNVNKFKKKLTLIITGIALIDFHRKFNYSIIQFNKITKTKFNKILLRNKSLFFTHFYPTITTTNVRKKFTNITQEKKWKIEAKK